ncbi:hypothetical protein QZH41_010677 [Actinostola sp. cb2023]|nr:hypothetical protein QZH41_010677 [Actinostola sp. cb2023]
MAAEVDVENDDKDRLLPEVFPDNLQPRKQESKLLTYLQCYFVTIAAILGTGILGLPVKLSNSGFTSFVVVFVLGFFAQVLVIYYFVEILQKAVVIKQDEEKKDSMLLSSEGVPLQTLTEENEDDSADDQDKEVEINREENGQVRYHVSEDIISVMHYPSLHSLAQQFLGPGLQQIFELAVLLMLLLYVIPIFTWICSFIIIFLQSGVQPFVSLLTFCKGSLFTACVLAAMYVGYFVSGEITEDVRSAGEPFLLGTVAIVVVVVVVLMYIVLAFSGGVINVMPMIFTKIRLRVSQVLRFRQAVIAGLVTCTILNILWCYAVLEIVPQKECQLSSPVISSFMPSNATVEVPALHRRGSCSKNGSLQWLDCNASIFVSRAEANGKISTIPLTEILQKQYTEFTWIALLIQIFVMISITVSFLTIGAALRHMSCL